MNLISNGRMRIARDCEVRTISSIHLIEELQYQDQGASRTFGYERDQLQKDCNHVTNTTMMTVVHNCEGILVD